MRFEWSLGLLLALGAGACADRAPEPPVVHVDITDDVFHRVKAGLLRLDREPLVFGLMGEDGQLLPHASMSLGSEEIGTFDVLSDARGKVAVYLSPDAVFSHLEAEGGAGVFGMTRVFEEDVTHPVGLAFGVVGR